MPCFFLWRSGRGWWKSGLGISLVLAAIAVLVLWQVVNRSTDGLPSGFRTRRILFFFFFDRNFAVPKTIKLVKARAGKVSVKGLFYLRSICCRMLRLGIRLGYVGIIVYTQSLLSTFSPLALKNRKMFNGMLAVEHAWNQGLHDKHA